MREVYKEIINKELRYKLKRSDRIVCKIRPLTLKVKDPDFSIVNNQPKTLNTNSLNNDVELFEKNGSTVPLLSNEITSRKGEVNKVGGSVSIENSIYKPTSEKLNTHNKYLLPNFLPHTMNIHFYGILIRKIDNFFYFLLFYHLDLSL